MEPHKLIIGLLLFGFMVSGGLYVMVGKDANDPNALFNFYEVSDLNVISSENLSELIVQDSTYNQTRTLEDEITADEVDADRDEEITIGPFRAIKRLTGYYTSANNAIGRLSIIFGVPKIVIDFAVSVIIVMIVFITIYMTFRFQPRS